MCFSIIAIAACKTAASQAAGSHCTAGTVMQYGQQQLLYLQVLPAHLGRESLHPSK